MSTQGRGPTRAFPEIVLLTRRKTLTSRPDREPERFHLLRAIQIDGVTFEIPQDAPVQIETSAGGPQLVTFTLFAGDVRFEEYDRPTPAADGPASVVKLDEIDGAGV